MDETYMTKMATAFLEELTEIEKQGQGVLGFLRGAVGGWGKALAAKAGTPLSQRMGIAKGGLWKQLKGAYKGGKGAQQGIGAGLGRVAQLRPVQMMAVPGALVGGGYLAGKSMGGPRHPAYG
jgi:hypothetical protein